MLRVIGTAGYSLLMVAQRAPIALWLLLVPETDGSAGGVGTRLSMVPQVLTVLLSTATLIEIC